MYAFNNLEVGSIKPVENRQAISQETDEEGVRKSQGCHRGPHVVPLIIRITSTNYFSLSLIRRLWRVKVGQLSSVTPRKSWSVMHGMAIPSTVRVYLLTCFLVNAISGDL